MDRPIIFSAPMVRALLDGRKSQTRRVLKPQPVMNDAGLWVFPPEWDATNFKRFGVAMQCPADAITRHFEETKRGLPYAPGERLYVREAHALVPATAYRMSEGVVQSVDPDDRDRACVYREGWKRSQPGKWRPSIHMPRWASRITLTVTEVRVQRLQEIDEADARAEGAPALGAELCPPDCEDIRSHVWGFHDLWESLHGPDAWDANPWVVAVTFSTERRNIADI